MVANSKRLIEKLSSPPFMKSLKNHVCSLSVPQLSHWCTSLKEMMRHIEIMSHSVNY